MARHKKKGASLLRLARTQGILKDSHAYIFMQFYTKNPDRRAHEGRAAGVPVFQAALLSVARLYRPAYKGFIRFHADRDLLVEEAAGRGKGINAFVQATDERLSSMDNGKGNYTRTHSREVGTLASVIGSEARKRGDPEAAGIDAGNLWAGGYTHDVGKTLLPMALLAKERGIRIGRLVFFEGVRMADMERSTLRYEHMSLGSAYERIFCDPAHGAELSIVRDMIGLHHVNYDGQDTAYPSYPAGIKGMDLSLPARIAKTADFLSAVLPREYRPHYQPQWVKTLGHAIGYAIAVAGTELDPFTVSCLLTAIYDVEPEHADRLIGMLRYPGGREDLCDMEKVKRYVMDTVGTQAEFVELMKKRSARKIAGYADRICDYAERFGVHIAADFPV
jgi:hypothetical protein